MLNCSRCGQLKSPTVYTHTWTSVGGAVEGAGQPNTGALNTAHGLYQCLNSVPATRKLQ